MRKPLAIIPARGGSKRIPRKNIRLFHGRPMIEYSIRAARNTGLFEDVIVSTDDNEIAEIARSADASVPFIRSSQTSTDTAGLADVLLEVIDRYESENIKLDTICCLLATAPL